VTRNRIRSNHDHTGQSGRVKENCHLSMHQTPIDAAGSVYVSEFGGERVMVLVAGTSTPKVLGPFTGLCGPTGVAVDRAGNLYVGDLGSGFGKGRVLMLAAGSSTAKGLPFGGLEYPGGVAVDSAGNVYAVDGAGAGNPRVVKLAATQRAGAFGARP
jgi:serine/threonine-protein kinase